MSILFQHKVGSLAQGKGVEEVHPFYPSHVATCMSIYVCPIERYPKNLNIRNEDPPTCGWRCASPRSH